MGNIIANLVLSRQTVFSSFGIHPVFTGIHRYSPGIHPVFTAQKKGCQALPWTAPWGANKTPFWLRVITTDTLLSPIGISTPAGTSTVMVME